MMTYQKYATRLLIIQLLLLLPTLFCVSDNQKEKKSLFVKLQTLVDSMIDSESEDPIHNAVLLVDCPKIKWKGRTVE